MQNNAISFGTTVLIIVKTAGEWHIRSSCLGSPEEGKEWTLCQYMMWGSHLYLYYLLQSKHLHRRGWSVCIWYLISGYPVFHCYLCMFFFFAWLIHGKLNLRGFIFIMDHCLWRFKIYLKFSNAIHLMSFKSISYGFSFFVCLLHFIT